MRVIAGEFRSRVLQAPKGEATRPTSDRLRETLFSVLEGGTLCSGVEGARFVDLYAGSGAVGIEAISRGSEFVWFAESARSAVAAIRVNLAALKIAGGYALEDRGAQRLLDEMLKKERAAEIVFLDPPYEAVEEYASTLEFLGRHHAVLLADGAVVVVEHARKQMVGARLNEVYGGLQRKRVLEQGDAALSFYKAGGWRREAGGE